MSSKDELLNVSFKTNRKEFELCYLAAVSGFGSALGSFFGKLSGNYGDSWFLTAVFFVLMVSCNTLGMLFFARCLNLSQSTVKATLEASSANYFFSAVIGYMFFKEKLSLMWWLGTSLIISGIIVIIYPQRSEKKSA